MGTIRTILIAVGIASAVAVFVWGFPSDPPPPRVDHAATGEDANGTAATSRSDRERQQPQREAEANAAPTATAAWLDHLYLLELEVLVVDRLGLPVEGHSLRLSPTGSTMIDAPSSGPDGRLTMSWPSRTPDGTIVLADERDTRRAVELRHGRKTFVVLLGQRDAGVRLFMTFARDAALVESKAVILNVPTFRDFARVENEATHAAQQGLHPFVVFDTGVATAKVETPEPVPGEVAMTVPATINFDLSTFTTNWTGGQAASFAFTDSPSRVEWEANLASIAGTVFGEDGKPAEKLPVALLGTGPQPLQQVETDEAGQFVFGGLPAGEFTVRAGGTDAGLATCPATTTTGISSVSLQLRRGSCVRGRALAANGAPLAGATVTWRASDGAWCDETTAGDDGAFVLANLPGTAGTVLVWAPGDNHRLPVASAMNVPCDSGGLVLRADADSASTLRIEPVLPDGIEDAPAVRVWNLDLGIAARMPDAEAGQPRALGGLGPAWYRVEIHHATTGWFDAGRHWIDGKTDCDLGRVVLPTPATVTFELDPELLPGKDQQTFEICSLRRHVDVRLSGAGATDRLLLPAGDYVFAWRGADGGVHFHRFTAVGGTAVAIRPR